MAPKSKQVACRARAEGKGKGKGIEPLCSHYEFELYRQLPLQAQNDVVSVAEKLAVTDDGMTIDIALPMANRIRREERDLFDKILSRPPVRVTRAGVTIYDGNDVEEMERILQPGDHIHNSFGQSVEYMGREEPTEQHVITVVRDGVTIYNGSDGDEARRLTRPGDHVSDNHGFSAISRGPAETGKGKGKGFEPFSGNGRRLDDLNSLD